VDNGIFRELYRWTCSANLFNLSPCWQHNVTAVWPVPNNTAWWQKRDLLSHYVTVEWLGSNLPVTSLPRCVSITITTAMPHFHSLGKTIILLFWLEWFGVVGHEQWHVEWTRLWKKTSRWRSSARCHEATRVSSQYCGHFLLTRPNCCSRT